MFGSLTLRIFAASVMLTLSVVPVMALDQNDYAEMKQLKEAVISWAGRNGLHSECEFNSGIAECRIFFHGVPVYPLNSKLNHDIQKVIIELAIGLEKNAISSYSILGFSDEKDAPFTIACEHKEQYTSVECIDGHGSVIYHMFK